MKVFRLNKTDEDGATVFTVDGQLATEYVNIVEESCDSAVTKGKRVRLQLRDVSSIDEAGHSLLRRLARKGIAIRGSGIYTSYIVQDLNAKNS
ncbi:MAG: STAS domain-containing protein [Bryobacteraceae bacterium]